MAVLLVIVGTAFAGPEVAWYRDYGANVSNWMRISAGLGDELIISGTTSGPESDAFIGSVFTNSGGDSIRGLTFTSPWHSYMYHDSIAASGPGGSPDYIVAIGWGQPEDDFRTKRPIIQVYRNKRSDMTRWNVERGVSTDYFQILAVDGLDARFGHFIIGAGFFNDADRSYDGVVAIHDLDGNERWRDALDSTILVNIHDMVVNGGILYVVGDATGSFAGQRFDEVDGFIRAYRLGRFDPERGNVPRHLWTRRIDTGWARDSEGKQGGLLYVTSDRAGNVYVAGETRINLDRERRNRMGLIEFPEIFEYGGRISSLVTKFDASGNRLWSAHVGSTDDLVIHAITADCSGNVWVAGATRGVFRGETRRTDEPHGGFIVRLNQHGQPVWVDSSVLRGRLVRPGQPWYFISDMELDKDGMLVLTGSVTRGWSIGEARGFIAAIRDNDAHEVGPDGFSRCPSSPDERRPVPPEQCLKTPDPLLLTLPGGGSTPHEGFNGDATCSNGWDDDHDGLCDDRDPDCSQTRREWKGTTGCLPRGPDIPPARERFPSPLCTDGIDNDGNGRCDHMEPACRSDFGEPDLEDERQPRVPVPMTPDTNTCRDAVQGRIAWDYKGTKTWAAPNLARLCHGAETSREPARCFERVMHGGINWGKSKIWTWQNALDLCAGTLDSGYTIACFEKGIAGGGSATQAIEACNRD